MQELPTFVIIGAGKSGTTAIHEYCDQHPEVFMTAVKETNFFELEGKKINYTPEEDPERLHHYPQSINNPEDYKALYRAAQGNEKAYGETSPMYLYGKNAPANIKKYVPEAKIIAILRNPVDRLYSRFLHLSRDGNEPTKNFEDALDQSTIWWRRDDLVKEGFYYTHLKRYYELFEPNQIKVFLYEDLKKDSDQLMRDLFTFIGVNPDFKPQLDVEYNVSGKPKNPLIDKLIGANSILLRTAKTVAPGIISKLKGSAQAQKMLTDIRKKNLDRSPLSTEVKGKLIEEVYKDEITKLGQLIHRDLSKWLEY
tara:strand:+ start:316 stop:1245 length:930 start_codon:yes stop_codon:yes gene_type:complete